jgi:hypothetical protein
MSAREVHVRIGRLVVDAPLRGEVEGWGEAIEHALRARLAQGTLVPVDVARTPEAIAQRVATRIPAAPGHAAAVTIAVRITQ